MEKKEKVHDWTLTTVCFGQNCKIAKMALLNPCMKSDFFVLFKSILLKQYENDNKKNIHKTSQGWPNPGFMQEKVQKGDFLKKPSQELKKINCFRVL